MKLHDNGIADFLDISEVAIADGLVAWYPLNGDAKDHTINRNDGTVNGAVPAAGVDGKLAYEFDGVDDYIYTGYGILDNTITMSCFVRIDGFDTTWVDQTIGYHLHSTGSGLRLYVSNSQGQLAAWWYDASSSLMTLSSGAALPTNSWCHVVFTHNGSEGRLYLNGTLLRAEAGSSNRFEGPSFINAYTSNSYFLHGATQDVRIYDRALNADEIKILYDITAPSLITMKQDKNTVYVRGEFQETL